jgi:8-oxo-dGTP diphosphatase
LNFRVGQAPESPIDLARLTAVQTDRTSLRIIVGAAIIADGRVLACARSDPPEVAGMWEFPGGKVEEGETDVEALIRECDEELGVRVEVGDRVGRDVRLGHGRALLRVYRARLLDGDLPRALEHAELRWLAADELDSVAWLPADAPIVAALPPLLNPEPSAP